MLPPPPQFPVRHSSAKRSPVDGREVTDPFYQPSVSSPLTASATCIVKASGQMAERFGEEGSAGMQGPLRGPLCVCVVICWP